MLLNANTIANLEIFRNQSDFKAHHSLFSILDHTKTSFGQRLLRRWVAKPLLQRDQLQERIDAVDDILNS
jgi:DNA mismatch repair protein MSH3